MFDLNGKTALVTGSTQGIGFEIARLLAEHGAKVYVNGAKNLEKCRQAAAQIPNSVPIKANLLNLAEIEDIYKVTGDIDILVLNASVQYKKKWDEYTLEEYNAQMDLNLKASYFLMKKYSKGMKKKGFGRIIAIGSVNQYNNHPELSLYGVTKAAQMKLVESTAKALASYGITINNISPGAINTPRNEEVLKNDEFKHKLEQNIPCRFIGSPADISPMVLLLCSNEGRYITGTDIKIDGGLSL